MAKQRCPICNKDYKDVMALASHIELKHETDVPDGWSGLKFIFYKKHGRINGKCMVCGKDTEFNETTGKPNRLCNNPNCKIQLRKNYENNMIKKYNKTTLLNDPEFQNKMLQNRSIAKDYHWSDGTGIKRVIGSYEYDGMQFLDVFMNFKCDDIIVPAPMIFDYIYEGKPHFYIPDAYISSLNLILEFKDGGEDPNTHHKIQAVDKVKEKLKEEAVKKNGSFNYIKIEDKKYGNFIKALLELKNAEDIQESKFTPLIITNEMTEMLYELNGLSNIEMNDNLSLNESSNITTDINELELIMEDLILSLPQEIKNSIDFPIKGLNILVESKEDYLLLKYMYDNNIIPEYLKENAFKYLIDNEDEENDDIYLSEEIIGEISNENSFVINMINNSRNDNELILAENVIKNIVNNDIDKYLLYKEFKFKKHEILI